MTADEDIAYHFAFLRVVPHVHLGAFVNVGVVLHARTVEFLGMRVLERKVLSRLVPDVDLELLVRYIRRLEQICVGDAEGGPIALLPPSERFHWLTAPRSDVLQSSPVHEGICHDPEEALAGLFEEVTEAVG